MNETENPIQPIMAFDKNKMNRGGGAKRKDLIGDKKEDKDENTTRS